MPVHFIKEDSHLASFVPWIMERKSLGCDTETSGPDPLLNDIVMLQIGNRETQLVIDARSVRLELLRPWFESTEHKKIIHNGKFDYKMLAARRGIRMRQIRDTYLAEKLLMNGKMLKGYSLEAVAKKYVGVDIPKDDRSLFGTAECTRGPFSERQIAYGARDVEHLLDIGIRQAQEIQRLDLVETWLLECEFLIALAEMELSGVVLDQKTWLRAMEENSRLAEDAEAALNQFIGALLPSGMNWNSPEQVLKVLQRLRVKVPEWNRETRQMEMRLISGTSEKILKNCDAPVLRLLKALRSAQNRIQTFGQSYLAARHPETDLLHFSWAQIGTETGRVAKGRDCPVNPLNIPRDRLMRSAFRGLPHEEVQTDDYKACELRIWAELSGDPKLRTAFEAGVDIHCHTASIICGRVVTKDEPARQLAKTINFGVIYGMGLDAIHEKVTGEGLVIDRNELQEQLDFFEYGYRRGMDWLHEQGNFALRFGYITAASGRRRNWVLPDPEDKEKFPRGRNDWKYRGIRDKIRREAMNAPIQSLNADITKRAMVMMLPRMKEFGAHFMNQLYDEIVTRCPLGNAPEFHPFKVDMMMAGAKYYLQSVPVEIDSHRGETWQK